METCTKTYRDSGEMEEDSSSLSAEGWVLQTVTTLEEGGVRAEYVRLSPEIPLGPPEDSEGVQRET